MTNTEAIKILTQRKWCGECNTDCSCKECDMAFDMAIKALEQEPAWTPVSEPPKDNGEYLVTRKLSKKFDIDIVDILSFNHNLFEVDKYEFAGQERAGWYDYDDEWGYYEMDDVTAWMPLPKPYKAESED